MTTPDFGAFLNWERSSRDTIDVKKLYIDMADDLVAGVLLSQIVYWYLPTQEGVSKLRISKAGQEWIAKARYEWWDECRISPKQVDRALKILRDKGLIESKLYKFKNAPTQHIRILKDAFLAAWNERISTKGENPFLPKGEKPISPDGKNEILPKGEMNLPETGKSLTESTSETTAKTTDIESSSVLVPTTPPPTPHDDDKKVLQLMEKPAGEGAKELPVEDRGRPNVHRRWKYLRAGKPAADKLKLEVAQINADYDDMGETILMKAMDDAEEKARQTGEPIFSWNFVRRFYPSPAEIERLKNANNPTRFVKGRYAAFINNTPPADDEQEGLTA